jgi:hypothetical protein
MRVGRKLLLEAVNLLAGGFELGIGGWGVFRVGGEAKENA